MSSVPEGRAANQPPAAITLMPPIGASLPGARSSTLSIFSPASSALLTSFGERFAQLACEGAVQLAGIAAGARGDLRRQQCRNQAVLVGGPHRAVGAQER